MRLSIISALLLATVASGCRKAVTTATSDDPDALPMPPGAMDWKQMHGDWKIVDSSRAGDAKQRDLEMSIRFENELMTVIHKDGKAGDQWHFGLGPGQTPKHLDLVKIDPAAKPKPKKSMSKGAPAPDVPIMVGIYDLNGDDLVLVIDWADDSIKRPASFHAELEGKTVRYRLERVKR